MIKTDEGVLCSTSTNAPSSRRYGDKPFSVSAPRLWNPLQTAMKTTWCLLKILKMHICLAVHAVLASVSYLINSCFVFFLLFFDIPIYYYVHVFTLIYHSVIINIFFLFNLIIICIRNLFLLFLTHILYIAIYFK